MLLLMIAAWLVSRFSAQPNKQSITVFAASSLTDALDELARTFTTTYQIEVVLNFSGSQTLATQIEQGARADLFASANHDQIQRLAEKDLAAEDATIFAENTLALIVPKENLQAIHSITDLTKPGILLVIGSEGVPIRQYTDQLLEQASIEYGTELVESIMANVVSEESNVRQIVARVVLGEADAAIVYRSDVTDDTANQVALIPLSPDLLLSPPRYFVIPLADSPNEEAAEAFIAFLLSDIGQEILLRWGFCLPMTSEVDTTCG